MIARMLLFFLATTVACQPPTDSVQGDIQKIEDDLGPLSRARRLGHALGDQIDQITTERCSLQNWRELTHRWKLHSSKRFAGLAVNGPGPLAQGRTRPCSLLPTPTLVLTCEQPDNFNR